MQSSVLYAKKHMHPHFIVHMGDGEMKPSKPNRLILLLFLQNASWEHFRLFLSDEV